MGKSLKVDKRVFERVIRKMLAAKPMKRTEVKIAKRKPAKILGAKG